MRSTLAVLLLGLVIGGGGVMLLTDLGPISADVEVSDNTEDGNAGTEQPQDDDQSDGSADGNTQASQSDGDNGDVSASSEGDGADTDGAEATATRAGPSDAAITGAISSAVQSVREGNNVAPLERSEEMDDLALHHSNDMASNQFFSNEAPWGDTLEDRKVQEDITCPQVMFQDPMEYRRGAQIIYRYSVESIPAPETIASDAVDTWRSSDRDGRFLLFEDWTRLGVATESHTEDGDRTVYVTVVFC